MSRRPEKPIPAKVFWVREKVPEWQKGETCIIKKCKKADALWELVQDKKGSYAMINTIVCYFFAN